MIRVCTVIGGMHGFRDAVANLVRIKVGTQILSWAKGRADLVVFPAGYLRCRRGADLNGAVRAAQALISAAREVGCGLVVGVDACSRGWRGKKGGLDPHVRGEQLPFFCVAIGSSGDPQAFRQRSTTSKNCAFAPAAANRTAHTLVVARQTVGIALCGEGFSRPIQRALVAPEVGAALVVLPAHTAAGMRQHNALAAFASAGVPAVRAVHAHHWADNFLWHEDGRRCTAVDADRFTLGDTWAEASIFDAVQTRRA